jgi:aspartyl aminopeptidase
LTRQSVKKEKMPIKICSSSSTSTTDLQQSRIISCDSFSQTTPNEDDDDDYANYEEIYLQKPSITIHENTRKKSDQTTHCRINNYSIACWTKPAYLLTN